tara:strand:+ start:510 stop:815 length:306 start_codon:yes stop_codon:yes gene_type:complete
MFSPKRVEDYVEILSKKYNLPKKNVREILMFGMKNITRMIKDGEDVRIPKFGNIYFDKKIFINYLKKKEKNGETLFIRSRRAEKSTFTFGRSPGKPGSDRI